MMERVKKILSKYRGGVVAFSGGKDSLALCLLAKEVFGDSHLCLTVRYPYTHQWTVAKAVEMAKTFSLNHRVVEMELPYELRENQPLRCYWCKRRMFEKLREFAKKGWGIFEGSLAGEEAREGLRAAWEMGVTSPFAEARVSKKKIINFLKEKGANPEEIPSETCLLTRLPLRAKFDLEIIRKIEKVEDFLREKGIQGARARWHQGLMRIEVAPSLLRKILALRKELVELTNRLNINFITLDLEGYREGSMSKL